MATTQRFVLLLLLFALLSSHNYSTVWACDCMPGPITVASSLNATESVLRGRVVRRLAVDQESQVYQYIVQVERRYKGCDFSPDSRIIIETGANSAMCGVTLRRSQTYLFSGYDTEITKDVQDQLDSAASAGTGSNGTAIKKAVSIGTCSSNRLWLLVRNADRRRLNNYNNTCSPRSLSRNKSPQ
jgi:Tissue inhibitor of metalloproteinase